MTEEIQIPLEAPSYIQQTKVKRSLEIMDLDEFLCFENRHWKNEYKLTFPCGEAKDGEPLIWTFYLQKNNNDYVFAVLRVDKPNDLCGFVSFDENITATVALDVIPLVERTVEENGSTTTTCFKYSTDTVKESFRENVGCSVIAFTATVKVCQDQLEQKKKKINLYDPFGQQALVLSNIASLFLTKESSSDVVITTIEGIKTEAHKFILMASSPVFSKMLDKKTGMIEAVTGKMQILDLSKKALDLVLQFLYTGQMKDDWVMVAEDILNAAEKYEINPLKKFLDENLVQACDETNASTLLETCTKFRLLNAKREILEHISQEY